MPEGRGDDVVGVSAGGWMIRVKVPTAVPPEVSVARAVKKNEPVA
jgi:hypothetical protein